MVAPAISCFSFMVLRLSTWYSVDACPPTYRTLNSEAMNSLREASGNLLRVCSRCIAAVHVSAQ
jgi:hypothetical protein